MSHLEILWFVFTDNFTANLFFTFSDELAIWIAPKLSDVEYSKILSAAVCGFFFASIVNYILGVTIKKALANYFPDKNKKFSKNTSVLYNIFDNFGYYILALGFFPIYCNLVVFFAGFARYKFLRTVLVVTLVKTIFYAVYR